MDEFEETGRIEEKEENQDSSSSSVTNRMSSVLVSMVGESSPLSGKKDVRPKRRKGEKRNNTHLAAQTMRLFLYLVFDPFVWF